MKIYQNLKNLTNVIYVLYCTDVMTGSGFPCTVRYFNLVAWIVYSSSEFKFSFMISKYLKAPWHHVQLFMQLVFAATIWNAHLWNKVFNCFLPTVAAKSCKKIDSVLYLLASKIIHHTRRITCIWPYPVNIICRIFTDYYNYLKRVIKKCHIFD